MEKESVALLGHLEKTVPETLETRRQRALETIGQLSGLGISVRAEVKTELEALAHPPSGESWSTTVGRLVRVDQQLRSAEASHVDGARTRAQRVAEWAGLAPERRAALESQLDQAAEAAKEGRPAESLGAIARMLREGLPEAVEKRRRIRDAATTLFEQAKELGAPTARLESALKAGADAAVEEWPDTVPQTEAAAAELGEALRERAKQSLQALRASVDATVEYGVDPGEARRTIDEALALLATAPALEIHPVFVEARKIAEEPVVTVIAGLLDEVRPRIAEARRLGRDPSEVFASMNRAREALRLKIYSEAFAASQEALERVTRLTEDLSAARDELQALDEMIERFRTVGFSVEGIDATVGRIRAHLEKGEVGPAQELLRTSLVAIGRDALQFFLGRWTSLDKVREYAQNHGFLAEKIDHGLGEARELLDQGNLAEAAESLSRAEVDLRTAATPYVGRRVEEMVQGLSDIPDDALTAPVRRQLADADVALRVKQDLIGSIESLRRAERDFAAVFAAHASSLVEVLETEGHLLEQMGGGSDEIQRQIDEVQQIFNMGDFVKASRASQEIRTRAQQQQLLRSEEAVSHAKLSLVELETMGVDLAPFRTQLEEAQAASRSGQFLDAYRSATKLEEAAGRARAAGQQVIEGIAHAGDQLNRLREAGIDPTPFYEPLREARLAFQALQFDAARTTLESVEQRLVEEGARLETTRLLHEIGLLVEDGRRLSTPMEPYVARIEQVRTERATAPAEATRTAARLLHEELIAILRPVLEENLRSLERDLDIARSAGVDLDRILVPLAEARRRIVLPVPIGAAALLDQARAEFIETRGLVDHAERVAKRARDALGQADLLHVDTVGLKGQMDRLDQLLAQRQFARAIELGGPLERDLVQATYQHVSKTLAGFQATVSRFRTAGVDTSLAENLLHQSRMALDEGRAVEALQLAARSESEIERADLQRKIAEGSLRTAEAKVAKAAADGIVGPAAEIEFEQAKASFQSRAYPDVLEHSMAALDALTGARDGHRRALDAVTAADRQVAEAKANGADVAEAGGRLTEARHLFEAGKYSEAIRAAREAVEVGRWSIERLFAVPLGDLRRQVDGARRQGLTTEVDPLDSLVGEGETALRSREWGRVKEVIGRGESLSRRMLDELVDGRWREIEAEYARGPTPPAAEGTRRAELVQQLKALREKRDFGAALALVKLEEETIRRRRKELVEARMAEFRDRLWVGERLGVDTTPVMQKFSEARVALDSGRLEEAELLLGRAVTALEGVVREPYGLRFKEVQTEVTFAEEGLHVSVGTVRDRLKQADELSRAGRLLDAARQLLKTEEDLNLRKSLHRELVNLHYLIDAALARAHDRRIDTAPARALLAESIRIRETDYAAALEKAREALRTLQEAGATPTEAAPSASPLWPFRRRSS